MWATFPQTLFATDTFNLGRFGEVLLSVDGRLVQPTQVAAPGPAAQALQSRNQDGLIQLDDGSNIQNPASPPYLAADGTLRIGDTLTGLSGVVSYAFGSYEVHPAAPPVIVRANPRSELPPAAQGRLRVASFNVLNYFTTLDAGGARCGPTRSLDCRGANTSAELSRQRTKILEALRRVDADILGLIELENDSGASLHDLVDGINALTTSATYAAVDTGSIGTDAIRVGLIYKTERVALRGNFAVLDASVDPAFLDTRNRPVLAQSFEELASGEALTIAVNHLKSKGSACDDIGDADVGDGQGNCNLTRTRAAEAELRWLADDPTASGDPDVLLIGDFNAYAQEDPIALLSAAGFTDLIHAFVGPSAYSFVFEGQSGYLDHALASPSLLGQVKGVSEWHINADEPRMLDYNQELNPPQLFQPDPFRSADHDPLVVGLDLGGSAPLSP
jgi:predicted extracellular nuclease